MELNEILKEEEPKVEEKETVVEEPKEEVEKPTSRRQAHREREQRARDEGGRFAPKDAKEEEPKEEVKEEKPEPPKQEMSEKERAFLATAQEERRKRQELERQLASLNKPQEEKKTFWDDPEGNLNRVAQQIQQERIQMRLQTSESIARSKYQDFDDHIGVFAEVLQTTPGLHAQWLQSPDPAEFAYRLGKHTKELRDVGSIDALREKIRKEERARIEDEIKKRRDETEKQRQDLTPSLSDVRGASRRTQPVFTGPTPLDDILGGK